MKFTLPHAALALFLCAAGVAQAQSSPAPAPAPALKLDTSWYVGLGVGHTTARADTGDYADARTGATTQVGTADNLAWKVYGGWRFSRYWAVETAYAQMGRYTVNYGFGTGGGNGVNKLSAWSVALLGIWPMTGSLSVYALAGAAVVHSDYHFTGDGVIYPATAGGSNNTVNPTLGLGASYAFARNFAVRFDYQSYGRSGSESRNFTNLGATGQSHPGLATLGLEAHF
jgi:opacity protein-like surface antigen